VFLLGAIPEGLTIRNLKIFFMSIPLEVKNVYGKELIYVNDELAQKSIQALTKKKTVDFYDIEALEALGVTFSGL